MSDRSIYKLMKSGAIMSPYDIGAVFYHESAVRELIVTLRASKRTHYSCDDSYYDCPAFVDPHYKSSPGECVCGADEWNAKIDELLAHYKDLKDES